MNISFYLGHDEVHKFHFKKFSRVCECWIDTLKEYHAVLEQLPGTITLTYVPATNTVVATFDRGNFILSTLEEQVMSIFPSATAAANGNTLVAA
jgi:hypothetical protein